MIKNKLIKLGKENNYFQRFEVVKNNRNKRYKYNEFFVEGVRNINQAINNGWDIKHIIYSGNQRLSDWATDIINNIKVESVFELTEPLMAKLSRKEDPSELIAIVSCKDDTVDRIRLEDNPLIVVFDRPSNRGNLGTMIRSCDALGCNGLIITGHAVDLYDPDTITSTMGSFFNLPTIRMQSHTEVISWVEKLRNTYPDIQIIGTTANTDTAINQMNFNRPTVLLIGNETKGLSTKYKESSDALVKIPIGGSASSLNVACAASILFYEVSRQRDFSDIN